MGARRYEGLRSWSPSAGVLHLENRVLFNRIVAVNIKGDCRAINFAEEARSLYLRRVKFQDGWHYVLRESYCDAGFWKHKDVADLGADPGECIEYTGGNGFYFQDELEEKLRAGGVDYSSEDLERLFRPFLKPHIRRIIENFQAHTGRSHRPATQFRT